MTPTEIAALAVAGLAVVLAIVALAQIAPLRRKMAGVRADGDVLGLLQGLDRDLGSVEELVTEMAPRLEAVEGYLPQVIAFTGVVTYDAFGDITGNQSRSIALMDARGDGVVISVLVGRAETRFFTKEVRGRRGVQPLSPEEDAAVARALAH